MVSTFRYRSFKSSTCAARRSYVTVLGIALLLLVVALHPEWVLLALASLVLALRARAATSLGSLRRRAGPPAGRGSPREEPRSAPVMRAGPTGRRRRRARVVIHEGASLLIRRGKEPLRGRWVVPGGTVELGETLEEALVREMQGGDGPRRAARARSSPSSTGSSARRPRGVPLRDRRLPVRLRLRTSRGRARTPRGRALVAPDELPAYDLPPKALEVVLDGFRRWGRARRACARAETERSILK